MKQWVKNEQLKKKTDSICFVNMFKFQEKQFQDCSKEFLGNKNNINKKRFLGKATGHNDHNMINMSSQKPKAGSNWLLTSPYLQRCMKKIHLSSAFLYCIIAYQNVSKRIISILTNHIIWITLLRYVIFNMQVEIDL